MRSVSSTWILSAGLAALALAAGCPDSKPRRAARSSAPARSVPPTPVVDQAFVDRALGPGHELANEPLVADIDERAGTEALVAAHKARRDHVIAVVDGNAEVLAQTPISGGLLAGAELRAVGPFKAEKLLADGTQIYMLPVETHVLKHDRPVCGVLGFRYRRDSLAQIGEFGITCWRRQAGGKGEDPYTHVKLRPSRSNLRIETVEETGNRSYRWDEDRQAFRSAPAQ